MSSCSEARLNTSLSIYIKSLPLVSTTEQSLSKTTTSIAEALEQGNHLRAQKSYIHILHSSSAATASYERGLQPFGIILYKIVSHQNLNYR